MKRKERDHVMLDEEFCCLTIAVYDGAGTQSVV